MKYKDIQSRFENLGYRVCHPINEAETKKKYLHLIKDGNYVGSFKPSNDSYTFQRKRYDNEEELIKAINEYNSTLEFRPETYDPDMRDDDRQEIRVYHTLRKYGLESKGRSLHSESMSAEGVLGMHYASVVNQQALTVGPYSWINLYDEEEKDDSTKCKSIDSIITAVYASNIARLCELLNNAGKLGKLDQLTVEKLDTNTMTSYKMNAKEAVKEQLQKALDMLQD